MTVTELKNALPDDGEQPVYICVDGHRFEIDDVPWCVGKNDRCVELVPGKCVGVAEEGV